MPKMTADDLAQIRRAVQLRDRCNRAAVAAGVRLGIPLSPVQANVAFDAMVDLIRADARPCVRVDPAVRFGRPHIRGASCEAIAGMFSAEKDPDVVCDEYGITRHELALACWFEAVYGDRAGWRAWAERAFNGLGGWGPLDVDDLPEVS